MREAKRKTSTGKRVWQWQVTGRFAAQLAMLLYPHLMTKREQVETVVSTWLEEWKPLPANWKF